MHTVDTDYDPFFDEDSEFGGGCAGLVLLWLVIVVVAVIGVVLLLN